MQFKKEPESRSPIPQLLAREHQDHTNQQNEGNNQHPLFPVAVFIMGIVSCYTTAVGLQPMLDNMMLSYAMAIALSIFMVAIALQMPRAYQEGIHMRFILGYSMVAVFSVLLNFNAIYGVFSAEKLLYEELKNNKNQLTSIRVEARESLDFYFDANETRQKLAEAKALLEEEKTNPRDLGYGIKARKINTEAVIPLQAKLEAIESRYDPAVRQIDSLHLHASTVIDSALAAKSIPAYREAVDVSIDAYAQIGQMTSSLVGQDAFEFEPLEFQHRDVGQLNHSLWTIGHLREMSGKEVSAVMVSLLLAILIDFIVLFVLVLLHKPGKKPEEEEEEQTPEHTRSTFQTPLQAAEIPTAYQVVERDSIYAKRPDRSAQIQDSPKEKRNGISSFFSNEEVLSPNGVSHVNGKS
ncbi:MAG: hypothetical protein AAFR66_08260 [Bacteroidota bacterium]